MCCPLCAAPGCLISRGQWQQSDTTLAARLLFSPVVDTWSVGVSALGVWVLDFPIVELHHRACSHEQDDDEWTLLLPVAANSLGSLRLTSRSCHGLSFVWKKKTKAIKFCFLLPVLQEANSTFHFPSHSVLFLTGVASLSLRGRTYSEPLEWNCLLDLHLPNHW